MNDNAVQRAADERGVPPPYLSFASFLTALRHSDRGAMRMAYVWYMPLLRDQARKAGAAHEEADEVAATVMADVLLHVQRADIPPRGFVRYLVSALRNRVRSGRRSRMRRAEATARAASDAGDGRGRIVAECHSEYGLRTSDNREGDRDSGGAVDGPLRTAIEKLAAFSAQALTESETSLMIGVSHHVPLRELAAQTGVSYGAARVRVHRLRERMRKLVLQHVATLSDDERRELRRFFRRAGISLAARPASDRAPLGPRRRDDATEETSDDT